MKTLGKEQTTPAYCPACIYYYQDCHPDAEDFNKNCDSFKEMEVYCEYDTEDEDDNDY